MSESIAKQSATRPFEFKGSGGEFFKIWIVNVLLSVITLGIYSAWAKVRTNRYFYGNTFFDGSSFEYHATGWQILKGRIIACIAFLIYSISMQVSPIFGGILSIILILLTPWIIWSSYRFQARMASYRQVRFSFDGGLGKVYKTILLLPFFPAVLIALTALAVGFLGGEFGQVIAIYLAGAAVISIYAMGPYIQALMYRYHTNNLHYGQGNFSAEISIRVFYKTMLIILAVFAVFFAAIVAVMWSVGFTSMEQLEHSFLFLGPIIMAVSSIGMFFFVFGFSFWARSFMEAQINNHVFNALKLDNALRLSSRLQTKSLFWIHVTNLLLVVFTFGLAAPFIKVRLAKYRANSTSGTLNQDLDHYVSLQQQKQSALGEELGGTFDIQGDLGLSL